MHCEGRASTWNAFDGEMAAMPVEDVFDQGQP
jgi:hypothetical protein